MSRYRKPLTLDEIVTVKDEEINFDDIPELDKTFRQQAIPTKSLIKEDVENVSNRK